METYSDKVLQARNCAVVGVKGVRVAGAKRECPIVLIIAGNQAKGLALSARGLPHVCRCRGVGVGQRGNGSRIVRTGRIRSKSGLDLGKSVRTNKIR